jgi:diguanylate cyclase (GGDEF)-like protein
MLPAIRSRTLRAQIVLLFGGLSFLIGLPAYWYINSKHRAQQIESKQERLAGMASTAATVLSENLTERIREIVLLTQNPLYRDSALNDPNIRANLERVRGSYAQYSWIGTADTSGYIQTATSQHLEGIDVSKRPWFQAALNGPFIGDVHEAVLLAKLLPNPSDQPIQFIDFSAPIYDQAGNLKGVLGAHAHWQWAAALLAGVIPQYSARDDIELFIINRKGDIIYPDNLPATFHAPPLHAITDNQRTPFLNWGDNTRFLTAAAPVATPEITKPLDWSVIVRQKEETSLSQVNRLLRVNFFTMIFAGLIFILLAWVVANKISRPVKALTSSARRIEQGEKNVKFSDNFWAVELQRLSDALRGMANTLIQQKEALAQNNQTLEEKVAARTIELQKLNIALERLARTDALTGLPNRMSTNERLKDEFIRFKRTGHPYSVLMLDVDFFKKINDSFGHAMGDTVLQHVATVFRNTVRESDFVGRTGGEEFVAILPMTDATSAMIVAEKVRGVIASTPAPVAGTITVSIGVQEVQSTDSDAETAVTGADAWMYQAKAHGRNCVKGASKPLADV